MRRAELERAISRLDAEDLTCVITDGAHTFESRLRGVAPLLAWLESGEVPRGCVAADRVVGKAAAFLYVHLGVAHVYARVMSLPAIAVLERYGIAWSADTQVEAIRNRAGTGYCPMERAVWDVEVADGVPERLREALERLKK